MQKTSSVLQLAIPDELLVARAVIRRNHKALRKNVLETPFMDHLGSFVSDEDEEEIENLKKQGKRIKATDYLLSLLIASRKPGWFQGLWMSLCQHGEFALAESLVQAQDNILSHDAFKSLDATSVIAIKESVKETLQVSIILVN